MAEEKVLVVDDEAGVVLLCERLLKRAGYKVKAFTNPEDALSLLEKDPVDLLLVDVNDGALEDLSAQNTWPVFLSGV